MSDSQDEHQAVESVIAELTSQVEQLYALLREHSALLLAIHQHCQTQSGYSASAERVQLLMRGL